MNLLKALADLFRRKEREHHDHTCHCGGLDKAHTTGVNGCLRFMVIPPESMGYDHWRVDGHCISGYTMREQRGYHRHPCGCWSRHEGSVNSLSA